MIMMVSCVVIPEEEVLGVRDTAGDGELPGERGAEREWRSVGAGGGCDGNVRALMAGSRVPSATWRTLLPAELPVDRVAARFGLISDTHMPERCPALPPALSDVFRGVDLILHAGDLGDLSVLDRLGEIAPVVAVHGNDDSAEAQRELPYQQVIAAAGQRIFLCHTHHPDPADEEAWRRSSHPPAA
jgi:hypothetical protein